MIYISGPSTFRPMPSTSVMSYSSRQVLCAGTLFQGAAYLGASVERRNFPIMGEVFAYELVMSIIDEHHSVPSQFFCLFDSKNEINAFDSVILTRAYFLKAQTLWAGLQGRDSEGEDTQFLIGRYPYDHLSLWGSTISYTDFSYTQEEEYRIPYADAEAQSQNLDFLKRDPAHSNHMHVKASENEELITSHVADQFIDGMDFEILKDVIEVINGEPRKTLSGDVAKYHYIISKAKVDDKADLQNASTSAVAEPDAKIKSLWGGTRIAKQLAIKNSQGEQECKYVYVVCRNASNLSFRTASPIDDLGTTISID